ncbi:uncharacterized protein [Nicotiana tomentosiformis]|uniref:uncharacterized protein n=1 Tax=Nicotiana tomentosiformis TaxID=4098 RepID=UPI00388CD53B
MDLGHMRKFFPRLRCKAVQQGHQPMITAPATVPPIRLARGGGQVGRGHRRDGGQPDGALTMIYAFSARPDAVALDPMIIGIIFVCSRHASVLFNLGSTYSYESSPFSPYLHISRESLDVPKYVSMLVGDPIVVDQVYRSYLVTFYLYEMREDLLFLDMTDFEVIVGMDWLFSYPVILDCYANIDTFVMPELPRFEWSGSSISTSSRVISLLNARHMVEKDGLAYLAYVQDTTVETPTIELVTLRE